MRRRWARWIGGVVFAIAVINFLAFFVHCMTLGGSAGNGKRVEGWYFVGEHGRYTEVSEQQWRIIRVHEISLFVTHPVGIVVGGGLLMYARFARQT